MVHMYDVKLYLIVMFFEFPHRLVYPFKYVNLKLKYTSLLGFSTT